MHDGGHVARAQQFGDGLGNLLRAGKLFDLRGRRAGSFGEVFQERIGLCRLIPARWVRRAVCAARTYGGENIFARAHGFARH